jgi:hypothetical protein
MLMIRSIILADQCSGRTLLSAKQRPDGKVNVWVRISVALILGRRPASIIVPMGFFAWPGVEKIVDR